MSKEAMKLALEAMENMSTALREDDVLGNDIDMLLDAITALREALAEQPAQQEPVGEAYLCDRCQTPFDGAYECPSCGHHTAVKEPVYTAPPQRTWVGLTEGDKQYLNEVLNLQGRFPIIDAIEAKSKEKNT